MPIAVPSLIPAPSMVVLTLAVAALLSVVVLIYSHQERVSKVRILAAALVAVAFIGWWSVRTFAAPEMCAFEATDPCRICKDLTPDSWLYWVYGCFAGC